MMENKFKCFVTYKLSIVDLKMTIRRDAEKWRKQVFFRCSWKKIIMGSGS